MSLDREEECEKLWSELPKVPSLRLATSLTQFRLLLSLGNIWTVTLAKKHGLLQLSRFEWQYPYFRFRITYTVVVSKFGRISCAGTISARKNWYNFFICILWAVYEPVTPGVRLYIYIYTYIYIYIYISISYHLATVRYTEKLMVVLKNCIIFTS